jgi:hypothetical protein
VARGPLGCADNENEASRDEQRRPHLRQIRRVVEAADLDAHEPLLAKKWREFAMARRLPFELMLKPLKKNK